MVIRVNKTKDYTVMANHHLRDSNLSLKAKGLLSQMLSLPESWDYSIDGLVALNKESRTAVMSALDELKENDYLTIVKHRNASGRFEYEYVVFEAPVTEKPDTENPVLEKPDMEKPDMEKPDTENVHVLNTNKQNTDNKILNNKRLKIKDSGARFKKPTIQEVKAYCLERGNTIDAERFIDYYEASGWKRGKTPIKDWRACVRTWERNEKSTKKEKSFEEIAEELERWP